MAPDRRPRELIADLWASVTKYVERLRDELGAAFHLKINRAFTTRYNQLASSFLGMVRLVTARY
jgi:hypothetical protein